MLVKIEINKKNLIDNIKKVKKINENIIFVLKDDAYGLGINNILPILLEQKYYKYMVADMDEASNIFEVASKYYEKNNIKINSDINKIEVIVLNYESIESISLNFESNSIITNNFIKPELKNNLLVQTLEYTIFSLNQFQNFLDKIENTKKTKQNYNIHLKINSGMNRLGFDENDIQELSEKLKCHSNIHVKSIYTHISSAEDEIYTKRQIKIFDAITETIEKYGINYDFKHVQASATLFKYSQKYNYDCSRIGMAIYGMEPLSYNIGLSNVVTVKSKIIDIRFIKKGEKVSYGDEIIKEDKRIAVVAIGYAHGLQKQIENSNSYVLINGEKAYLIGEVCMDMIIVDISNISNVYVGDDVVVVGKSGDEELTIRNLSYFANTIQDDILTKFNKKIIREVINE